LKADQDQATGKVLASSKKRGKTQTLQLTQEQKI